MIDYFALGDSLASGHGLTDDGGSCRQSLFAYPHSVADALAKRYTTVNFTADHFLACSGATAAILPARSDTEAFRQLSKQVDSALDQISKLPTDRQVAVSITVGSDDFQFANPDNFLLQLYHADDPTYNSWVGNISDLVKLSLERQVKRLLDHANVAVAITEVYNPFNKGSVYFIGPYNSDDASALCQDYIGLYGSVDCYQRAQYAINMLNHTYDTVSNDIGMQDRFTVTRGLAKSFVGHESPRLSCGTALPDASNTWVQYPDDPNSNANPPLPFFITQGATWHGDCFHPNADGAKAYAKAVESALQSVNR